MRRAENRRANVKARVIVGQCILPTHTWRKSDCTDNFNTATFNCQVEILRRAFRRRSPKTSELTNDLALICVERDALAFSGFFPTSIYADNVDGEVLALEHNQISGLLAWL
jgi:hypothetical protein